MKILSTCSYCCAFLSFALVMFMVVESHGKFFFILVPPILQILYTQKTSRSILHSVYKETELLDDPSAINNAGQHSVIGNNFWMKAISIFNSVCLCLFIIAGFMGFNDVLNSLRNGSFNGLGMTMLIFIIVTFLLAFPTILFNLWTFNLKRVIGG